MDTLSCITLILAIATFGLAGTAVWSILQTRNIQKREYKHRRLNEIIEWATKVISWRPENRTVFREMANKEDNRLSQRLMHAHIAEVQAFFTAITGLNKYISKLSLTFQQGLPEDIQKLINDLETFTDFLGAWGGRLFTDIDRGKVNIDMEKDGKQADELDLQIAKSASIVLEKVADIKGKEIG